MKPLHIHVTLASFNHMTMNGSRLTVMLFAASLGASPALIGLLDQTVGRYGTPQDRANNFSTQALAISMATFLGPLSAGIAIDHLGYANAFFVTAAFGFTPMAAVWMGLLKLAEKSAEKREEPTPVSGWALLKDHELRRAYIAAASNNAIWSIWGFMPPLYGHSISLSTRWPPACSAMPGPIAASCTHRRNHKGPHPASGFQCACIKAGLCR